MPKAQRPISSAEGLSDGEVQVKLKSDGYNELPRATQRTPLRIILEVLKEPMLLLLLGGGGIYLLLGKLQDAVVLIIFAMLSVSITVIQEWRTERVLDALRELTSPRALVIRNGERKRIPGRDVVQGDIIVLAEGDRVPADAVLLEASDLQTDESLLTGESVPVRKIAGDGALPATDQRPGGDDLPTVYSGALVVRGSGMPETRTIQETVAGQIAVSGQPPKMSLPPLGRPITVNETVSTAAFLLSDDASGMTGQVVTVCAGAFV